MFRLDDTQADTETSASVIRRLARDLCKGDDFDGAERSLVDRISADAGLTAYAVKSFAHAEIRFLMATRRAAISGYSELERGGKLPKVYPKETMERVNELGGKFLSWPLSTGKRLSEATLADVVAEAEMYEAHAKGNALNGRFFRLVAARLKTLNAKPNEKVGKVLDDRCLEVLMGKARKAAE